MKYKTGREGSRVFLKSSFCQCIAEKFAFGGKLPDEEVSVYINDFGELLRTKETQSDVFYPYSVNTCFSCGSTLYNTDLKPYCIGPGPELGTGVSYYHRNKEKNNDPGIILPTPKDYEKIITAILNGQYNTIKTDLVYKHFYVAFIQAYSDWCKKCMGAAEVRKTFTWEEQDGIQIGPTWEREITIEIPYIDTFDRYISDIDKNVLTTVLSGKLHANMGEMITFGKKAAKSVVECRLFLNNYLKGGKDCSSESTQTVYKGLLILKERPDK
jgi:hypothetical protein